MSIRLEQVQAVVRFYEDEATAAARGPYIGIANVIWISPTRVFVMGMHGTIRRSDLRALFVELRNHGVTTVDAERRGKYVTYSLEDLDLWIS